MIRTSGLLTVAICAVLCAATGASADSIAGTLTGGSDSVTVSVSRITNTGVSGVDELIFKINSITAPVNTISTISALPTQPNASATWTAVGSGQIALSSANASWYSNTTAPFPNDTDDYGTGYGAPQTYVNLEVTTAPDARTAAAPQSTFGSYNGYTYKGYSMFYGNWYLPATPADAADYPTVGSILAGIYVSSGSDVSFTGGFGLTNNDFVSGSFSSVVPEPSTLALLASGLVGLLAYAWRKRK
jgi:hypothetical protein